MKLLMIIVDESVRDEVESVLERHRVDGYSEIPMVLGEGLSGKRFSSRLHPGANSIVFTIIDDEKLQEIRAALLATCKGNVTDPTCPKPIHIVVLKVEEFV